MISIIVEAGDPILLDAENQFRSGLASRSDVFSNGGVRMSLVVDSSYET
jgi:hypothetical protein